MPKLDRYSGHKSRSTVTHKWTWILIATYVNLWIIEGAVRKWIPGTDQIFYIIRDGVALLTLVFLVIYTRLDKGKSIAVAGIFLSGVVYVSLQSILDNLNYLVAFAGLRSYIAPLLFASVAYLYPSREFAQRIARIVLLYAPAQAGLVILQVLSPPESILNKLVSSDQAYFVNDGIVRATGTFSSPSGLVLYAGLLLALALWKFQNSEGRIGYSNIIQLISALLIIILSGSRSALLSGLIVMVLFAYVQFKITSSRDIFRLLFVLSTLTFATLIAFHFFPMVIDSFTKRINDAAVSEDSSSRLLGGATDFLFQPISPFGSGAGVNSQAGIGLGSNGIWIEGDSTRWVAELGILGWCLASARLAWSLGLIIHAFLRGKSMPRLRIMVIAALIPSAVYGSITQNPTAQGFFSICIALLFLVPSSDDVPSKYPRTIEDTENLG